MFNKFSVVGAILACAVALGGAAANASVIDFTSASTGHSGSVNNGAATWSMTASGYLNNSQKYDGSYVSAGAAATGLSFESDGYGVGKNDDEITTKPKSQEWIQVTFSKPVLVNAIYFLDLFISKNRQTWEVGQATIDGKTLISVVASDVVGNGAPGFAATVFKPIYATVIRFTILSSNDALGFADGALAGIGLAPVPLPAAGGLMIVGLGGLAALRRRKQA